MISKFYNLIHEIFDIGLILKGLDGVLEIIGGLILLVANPAKINNFVILITQHELNHDPDDLIANWMINTAQNLSISTELFGAFVLLSHGIIKIFLVIFLLKDKLWAFPTAISVFSLFVCYQLYRYAHTHSPWLIVITVVDIFIITLTALEYKRVLALRRQTT